VYSKPKLLIKMNKHISQYSIAELILSFIAYEPSQYDEKNQSFLDMKIQIVEELLDNFALESDLEVLPKKMT